MSRRLIARIHIKVSLSRLIPCKQKVIIDNRKFVLATKEEYQSLHRHIAGNFLASDVDSESPESVDFEELWSNDLLSGSVRSMELIDNMEQEGGYAAGSRILIENTEKIGDKEELGEAKQQGISVDVVCDSCNQVGILKMLFR